MREDWRCVRRIGFVAAMVSAIAVPARSDVADVRARAIAWLETRANADGSYGEEPTRPLVTAEVLLALAKANRGGATPAARALAWLRSQNLLAVDYRARRVRALAAIGADLSHETAELAAVGLGTDGWGVVSSRGITSYDSALALGALAAAGVAPGDTAAKLGEIMARQRLDSGWSGDDVPTGEGGSSDPTVTAEIARALVPVPGALTAIDGTLDALEQGVGSATPTLEVAARLAALHAAGRTSTALESELLSGARLLEPGPAGPVWSDDAYVNAIGLLALTTRPGSGYDGGPQDDDDGDGVVNAEDAFPHDPLEHADFDGDGIGDVADLDRDGDGTRNLHDDFPDDPSEVRDTDGDGVGDVADLDDDDDGVSDSDELAQGSDPRSADTDGDGIPDATDGCVLVVGETDADGDGVCAPLDQCDDHPDPFDIVNTDGEGACDLADNDDDGDGVPDVDEVAWGSDPRSAASRPPPLSPSGDEDGDGTRNSVEESLGTSPFRADTDSDGHTDTVELYGAGDPLDPATGPGAALATFAGASNAPDPLFSPSDSLRATATLGQPTPVAPSDGSTPQAQGPGIVLLPGFQAQTLLARDLDGDALIGFDESELRTSDLDVDSDADGFADGPGGVVPLAQVVDGYDVDEFPGFADGEGDVGTDPADPESRPGSPGDVAPLGRPDGRVDAADGAVAIRIVRDPDLLSTLQGDHREIAEEAADTNQDQAVDLGDAVRILREVRGGEAAGGE